MTAEYVALKEVVYALEMRMWQAAGGNKGGGAKPKPPKIPEDREVTVTSADELQAKRQSKTEHLRRRRAQRASGTS